MLKKFEELVLVDVSPGILRRAAKKAKSQKLLNRMHLIAVDFRLLPLRNECLDMSCSFGKIEPRNPWMNSNPSPVSTQNKGIYR